MKDYAQQAEHIRNLTKTIQAEKLRGDQDP